MLGSANFFNIFFCFEPAVKIWCSGSLGLDLSMTVILEYRKPVLFKAVLNVSKQRNHFEASEIHLKPIGMMKESAKLNSQVAKDRKCVCDTGLRR